MRFAALAILGLLVALTDASTAMAQKQKQRSLGDPSTNGANTETGLPGAPTYGSCGSGTCVVNDDQGNICMTYQYGRSCWYDPHLDKTRPEKGGTGINKGGSTGSGTNGSACSSAYVMVNGAVQCGGGSNPKKN